MIKIVLNGLINQHVNKFKVNLKEKLYFKNIFNKYIDNKIIKKCDRSYDMCAIKYDYKSSQKQSTLILQEYVKDNESVIT